MFRIIALLFFVPIATVSTQTIYERLPYDYIWLFNNSRMDFNYDPVLIEADDQPMPFEGTNASICDEQGALLAYTNGIYVSNAQGDTVRNGWQINDSLDILNWLDNGVIWPQHAIAFYSEVKQQVLFLHGSATVFPEPNENNSTIFCLGLKRTLYDLTLDSIIIKNETLINDTIDLGKITATRSGDGESWWIGVSKYYSNKYYMLTLTDLEVKEIKQTESGEIVPTGLGQAKFSPNGKKYVDLDLKNVNNQTISIYDFDRCTGELSNPVHIPYQDTSFVGGIAFSENSRFLYVPSFVYLYQYDLAAEDIVASKVILRHSFDGWGYYMAQLAPNGKIYISHQGTQDSIHVIHHPNRKGHACGFEHLGQPLPANTFRTMPNYPYYGLGPWDGSPCDTLNIDNPVPEARYEHTQDSSALQLEFFDASHYAYEWSWDFGDGSATATEQHPIHTYSEIGTYEVCLTVSNVTGIDTYCETIQIGPVGTQEIFAPGVAVKVWPNPVSKEPLYFQISGFDNKNTIYLYLRDSQGRLMLKDTFPVTGGTNQHQLNIDHLPPGLYFYELYRQGLLASGKVVIGK
jgi:hypothetical protein